MNVLASVGVIILQTNMFVQVVNWVIVNQNRFGSKLENPLLMLEIKQFVESLGIIPYLAPAFIFGGFFLSRLTVRIKC